MLSCAAAAGLISLLLSDRGGIRRYMRFAAALALLAAILFPLSAAVSQTVKEGISGSYSYTPDMSELGETQNRIIRGSTEQLSREIASLLASRYGISADESDVIVTVNAQDSGNVTIEAVVIDLTGTDMWKNALEIEEYIKDLLGCRCTVRTK